MVFQRPLSSDSKADAPLYNYHSWFRDPFSHPRGFPPSKMPFIGGSRSGGERPDPSHRC